MLFKQLEAFYEHFSALLPKSVNLIVNIFIVSVKHFYNRYSKKLKSPEQYYNKNYSNFNQFGEVSNLKDIYLILL